MTDDLRSGGIAILDYGSQYTQLIARRLREMGIYAEVFAYDAAQGVVDQHQPRGYVLSGGPAGVYEADAPTLSAFVLASGLPVLGICYGLQLLMHTLGGAVVPSSTEREFGQAIITRTAPSALTHEIPDQTQVWMSHGDKVTALATGFSALATSDQSPFAIVGDETRHYYGVQFHPEVKHTQYGNDLLIAFAGRICGCAPRWTSAAFIEDAVAGIRAQVGDEKVLLGLSGGVDSAVAAALIHRAIGDQLTSIFVNTGMLRLHEAEQVLRVFRDEQAIRVVYHDATELFLDALQDVTEPEQKRKTIGKLFIDVFRQEADALKGIRFLAQGTIYPDVIESAKSSKTAHVIKSHHNVGGLPEQLGFELVEPLRDLFKDEVRRVGTALGLPDTIVWRQPFPGPGLAIRCLGDLTLPRLNKLRQADAIFLDELGKAGLLVGDTAQCFAVLLPVKAVGVMGDQRTYEEVIVLRAVQTDDFMTADWARLPYELLAETSKRIVNEVKGVNRVAYDITSKPPGTIEWE